MERFLVPRGGGDGATGCPGTSDFQADKDKLIEELLKMVQR